MFEIKCRIFLVCIDVDVLQLVKPPEYPHTLYILDSQGIGGIKKQKLRLKLLCLLCQACELILRTVEVVVNVIFVVLVSRSQYKARNMPSFPLLRPTVFCTSLDHYFYFSRVHVTQNCMIKMLFDTASTQHRIDKVPARKHRKN